MARQNERKMKLYMEAGLAVLLVLTIALASVSGRLSSQAHEKDKNKQEAACTRRSGSLRKKQRK